MGYLNDTWNQKCDNQLGCPEALVQLAPAMLKKQFSPKEKDGCGACMALGYDSLCCVHLCVFESPWVSSLVEKWVLNVLKDFLFIYLESPCPISITIFSAATVLRVYEVSQTLCLWLVFVSSLLIGQQQNEGLAAGIVV